MYANSPIAGASLPRLPKFPKDPIQQLLEDHSEEIRHAGTQTYRGGTTSEIAGPVPYGEFQATKDVLVREIRQMTKRADFAEKAVFWVIVFGLGSVIWLIWINHSKQRWEIKDFQSPVVTSVSGGHAFYYRWGKDVDGNIGWVPCNSSGEFFQQDILIAPDGKSGSSTDLYP
jgi:hypothetical protein